MAFVNEYVEQEDIEKYGLAELHRECSMKAKDYDRAQDGLHEKNQWMIDREREIWFMRLGLRMIKDIPPIYLGNEVFFTEFAKELAA